MSCPTTSAQAYENCFAPALFLQSYGAIGLEPQLSAWVVAAVAQSKPPGVNATYAIACEACLRARGILYYHSTPGDCGAPSSIPGVAAPQIAGLSGSAAGGIASGLGAAGIIGGAATLGITTAISVGVGAIEGIFAHHAEAVKNEQNTICAVMNYFNPLITRIDAAVKSGVLSPDAGCAALTQICQTAINGLAGIMQTCNAACYYRGMLQAHIYFAKNYYPAIAPVSVWPQNPGSPPDGYGTPPGGVTVTGNNPPPPQTVRSLPQNTYLPAGPLGPSLTPNQNLPGNAQAVDYLNLGYNQQTGQSAQAADVPNTGINWPMIGAIAAIIALLVTVL
jgi:hypothetical protein